MTMNKKPTNNMINFLLERPIKKKSTRKNSSSQKHAKRLSKLKEKALDEGYIEYQDNRFYGILWDHTPKGLEIIDRSFDPIRANIAKSGKEMIAGLQKHLETK